jgi:hypothetical protein
MTMSLTRLNEMKDRSPRVMDVARADPLQMTS